jgi:hypothetical protein
VTQSGGEHHVGAAMAQGKLMMSAGFIEIIE